MEEVYRFINRNLELSSNDTVVVGVSGGPDSMALLYILNDFKEDIGFKLVCAHVNHNKRIESEQEKIDLEKYCKKNNIIFEGANIELEKGKVYLLTGENGSGKSTLLRMLAGLIACDKMCDIRWFGEKISSFSKLKNKIIYVKEAPYLYDYLTGKENLELLSEVLEINEKERNVIIAHQFVTGASKCGSEEVSIGGYFMHARGGLSTEYMGDEWFDNVSEIVDFFHSAEDNYQMPINAQFVMAALAFSFGMVFRDRTRTDLNATVRWTVACRQLDGGNTLIFAKGENANESLTVYHIGTQVLCQFI